jgi:hypothetical protein
MSEVWYPKYVVSRTDRTPIPIGEPCFIVRAQDALAPAAIRAYLELAKTINSPAGFLDDIESHLARVEQWQLDNGRKLPD